MYRIIGAFFIILSAFFGGYTLVTKEKKHIKQLDGVARLIRHIYKQIEAFNLPLCDILESTDAELLSVVDTGDGTAPEITLPHDLLLTPKERGVAAGFFSGLGRCYRDEELRLCRYYSDEIESLLTERRKEYPKKKKLCFTLSICGALGLVILMI